MKRVCFLALVSLAGCVSEEGPPPGAAVTGAGEIERTIVTLGSDGSEVVTRTRITREEQLRELEERARFLEGQVAGKAPIVKDSGCAPSSLWMFDQVSMAGHEICFFGGGHATLNNYPRCTGFFCSTWKAATRSYWAGVNPGYFSNITMDAGLGGVNEDFSAYQHVSTAGATAKNSTHVTLYEVP